MQERRDFTAYSLQPTAYLRTSGMDRPLAVIFLFLSLWGILMVFSASGVTAMREHQPHLSPFEKQGVSLLIAAIGFWIAYKIDYQRLSDCVPYLALGIVLSLISVLLWGQTIGGAKRWLPIGTSSIQPSEFAKLFVVIYLSHYTARKREVLHLFRKGLMPAVSVVGTIIVLVLAERDFGAGVILFFIAASLLFFSEVPRRHLVGLLLVVVPLLAAWMVSAPYRMERLKTYLEGMGDGKLNGNLSFQIRQSYIAMGSGGFFGVGLGWGQQAHDFLPEPQTDFIYAIIGEEFGFLGTVTLLLLFLFLLWRGFFIGRLLSDPYAQMLAIGLTLMIVLPAMINMGVVTGLFPTKGLSLPFISYGGSSLLANSLAAGLLMNLARDGMPLNRNGGIG